MTKCDPVVIVVLQSSIHESRQSVSVQSTTLLFIEQGLGLGVLVVSVIFDFACK